MMLFMVRHFNVFRLWNLSLTPLIPDPLSIPDSKVVSQALLNKVAKHCSDLGLPKSS